MLVLRKPTVADIDVILRLMEPHVRSGALLPRGRRGLVERLRDFTVAEERGVVVGVVSLALVGESLAELGVLVWERPDQLGQLVDCAFDEARSLGVERVFVLAADAAPFEEMGFRREAIEALPEKRERQCLRCPRMPSCRQVALVLDLAEVSDLAA